MFIKLLFCASIVLDSEVLMEREGGRGRKRAREGEEEGEGASSLQRLLVQS